MTDIDHIAAAEALMEKADSNSDMGRIERNMLIAEANHHLLLHIVALSVSIDDLRDAAKYVRYWSESDNCDDTPSNIARLHCLADRLLAASGVGL